MSIEDKVSKLDTRVSVVENMHKELDARMLRHRKDFESQINQIMNTLDRMRSLLNGDVSRKGMVAMIRDHEDWIKLKESKINIFFGWIYKSIVIGILAWIALHTKIVF